MKNELITAKQSKKECRDLAASAFPETQVLRSYAESIGMKDGDLVTMDDCPDISRVTLVDTITVKA